MTIQYKPATPYARTLANEHGIDLHSVLPTGAAGEVKARDVLALIKQGAGTANIAATPLARRMAKAQGLDLSQISGSGWNNKVTKTDVLSYIASGASAVSGGASAASGTAASADTMPDQRKPMSGMRKVVAARMLQSHTEIPSVTNTVKVDVTALLEARSKLNENSELRISVNDFVLMAAAKALKSNPQMLISLDGNEIIQHSHIHLGMAVSVADGLLVPVIKDADQLSLQKLSKAAKDLAVNARNNKLSPDAFSGSTFTVTNLGMFDVESFTPIINQPNAAILGVCCVDEELALKNGAVTVRKIMRTCLTFDHRLLDGVSAARFQKEVKRLLENPIEIVM